MDPATLRIDDREVPFQNGVARFRNDDGYNDSFARQWKEFRLTQYDDANGTSLTRDRYFRETGWPDTGLDGELMLEAGCGAGRFTRILAATGASLLSFDYSSAVDVSAEQNGHFPNVAFAQADIFDLPFAPASFDRVFCHGVLQHTPDPAGAFRKLEALVKPGGAISIDVYLKDGKIRPWKSKYLWRWWTTRISPERLLAFLERFIPLWLPFDTLIKRIPVLGTYLGAVVPCWNYFYTDLPPDQKIQWAILDTFDALAPSFDNPVTLDEVRSWFIDAGYNGFEVREGGNGVVGNGRKPT
jgi:SAM-dependent methyltransferase